MFFRQKQPRMTRQESLKAVPVKNQSVEETRTDSGEVVLYLPRRDTWWIKALAKIFYIPKGRRIALDELGVAVWDSIDGKKNVGKVIKEFARQHDLEKREAELSVVAYLRLLAKRGLIGIAIYDKKSDSDESGGTERKNKRKR